MIFSIFLTSYLKDDDALKGEVMLGSYPNLPTLGFLGYIQLMYKSTIFEKGILDS